MIDPEKAKNYILTKTQAIQRKASVGSVKYVLSLNLLESLFSGTCQIEFEYFGGDLWFDFNGDQLTSVQVNGAVSECTYMQSKIYFENLPVGLNTIVLEYLRHYSNDGYGLHMFKDIDESVYLYSNFEPFHAHKMFPCFDQPDIKATFVIDAKCPSSWTVLSNEPKCKVLESLGTTTHFFEETSKISTYLVGLVAGDYHEVRLNENPTGISLGLYCRKALISDLVPERYFKWTIRGFAFYQHFFDIKYPFKKYDQIFVPEFNAGAMENVGLVTFKETYLCKNSNPADLCLAATTFLHEMSHMWFGNLVTMRWWDDLWLNESFATYLSYFAVNACLSDDFHQSWVLFLRRKSFAYLADQKKTTHPVSGNVENTSQTRSIFDSISYGKGSAVLKQLVFVLGEEEFKCGISEYLKENSFGNTEFVDLVRVLSRRSPGIEDWAQKWIQMAGVNVLTGKVDGNQVKITQVATGTCEILRSHDVFCEFFDENGKSLAQSRVRITDAETVFTLETSPSCLVINSEDHDYCKVVLEEPTIGFMKSSLHTLQSPVNRMLLIINLSEMVNDCLISPIDFLEIIATHVNFETEPTISAYMLNLVNATLLHKVKDKKLKSHYYQHFFTKILEKISICQEFHDLILSFCYTDSQILQAVQWLESDSPIKLTQHRRWRILKMYARISISAKALVDSEADLTAEGVLERLYCESVFPDAESKEKIWEKFMQGCPGLSRFQRKSLMSGFMKKSQKDILQKYADLYFAEFQSLCERLSFEFVLDFCTLVFPSFKNEAYLSEKVQGLFPLIKPEYVQLSKMFKDKLEILSRNNRIKNS